MNRDVLPAGFFPHSGSGSRIQGSKYHRIPDPDPQHCTVFMYQTCARKKMLVCDGGIEEELFDKKQQMGISILCPVVTNPDGIN
jgi:hypothetical protein